MSDTAIPDTFPVTANELSTRVLASLSQHLEIGVRATFDDHLDAETLARAVRLSLDAEPILGCALRLGTFRSRWERLGDLDERILLREITCDDPEAEAIRSLVAPIDISGPQVAVTLVRGREGDEVCVRLNHDVADGQAAKQYAYLLAALYSKLMSDAGHVPAAHLGPRPDAMDVWRRLSAEQRRLAARMPRMTMPNWELPPRAVSGRGRTLRELRVPPAVFDGFKAYGKARGATVNDMLLTAFFRAVTAVFPPPDGRRMSLPFSAEHRRFLPDPEDLPISNLSTSVWLGVPYVSGETFEGSLERVMTETRAWRSALWGVKGLADATRLAKLGYGPMSAILGTLSKAARGKTTPIFTNIGILDDTRLAFGPLVPVAARMSGPAAFGTSLVPTVSTYRGTLTVSMGFCAEDVEPETIETVLERLEEETGLVSAEARPA